MKLVTYKSSSGERQGALIEGQLIDLETDHLIKQFTLLAPVPNPPSCRDGYAFRQHVAAARRNRGLAMIPEFDQYPSF